jgi:hypothetical protein
MDDAAGRAHGAPSSLGKPWLAWQWRPGPDFFLKNLS